MTKREDPRDCLISRDGRNAEGFAGGRAHRHQQPAAAGAAAAPSRPTLKCSICAETWTRECEKVAAGEFDAIVLAVAGVTRLGARDKITEILPPELMLPAVGQGALGIETREDDRETSSIGRGARMTRKRARA